MKKITITYHNQTKDFYDTTTYYEVSKAFLVDHPIVAEVEGELTPLDETLSTDCVIDFYSMSHISGYKIYQAGLKYLFYAAVKELYSFSDVHFLHSVPKGILSEVILDHELSMEEVSKIKGKMAEIVHSKERFIRYHLKPIDAYNYLMANDEKEKAVNIQFAVNDLVTMYRLKNHFNYFYNLMPYDTSVLDVFELVYLKNNRIVLVVPSIYLKGKLPEYVHYENIIQNFMQSKKWLNLIHTPYLGELNKKVANNEIKDFVLTNELVFQEDIINACEHILKNKEIKFVLIAGPSSSGKTTTMQKISTCLKSKGYDPVSISTDDFFVNKVDTPKDENGDYNFECLEAIDLALFNDTLVKLLNFEEVELPTYDFQSGKRIYTGKKVKLTDRSIVLIEGLHCLNDELLPNISKESKYKIYLSPFMPLNIDRHNYVSTLDLRLLRRLTRDRRDRARSVDETISLWQKVRIGEEKYIFPYVFQADLIINTALAYEPGVLKVYALPLLYSVSINSPYYAEARRLIKMLDPFFTISSEVVPKDSILREFIGKLD